MLNDSYKPKYLQLVDIIRRDILSGKLQEGDRLLSENELKMKYDLSSTTVRKCIDILRSEGLITRIQGVGTFVQAKHVERSLEKVLSFTKNMQQAGIVPSTDVLDKQIMKASGKYLERLNLLPGNELLKLKAKEEGSSLTESLAILVFLLLATLALFLGTHVFFHNYLPAGRIGELVSAGVIPLYNIAVGIEVGAALFTIFLALAIYKEELQS